MARYCGRQMKSKNSPLNNVCSFILSDRQSQPSWWKLAYFPLQITANHVDPILIKYNSYALREISHPMAHPCRDRRQEQPPLVCLPC
jgi:hypothetical protein